MSLFLTTFFVFGFVMFIMAIGVILGNRQIQGSCGGEEGCEICFFKLSNQCEGKLSCDGKNEPSGKGGLGVCEASGFAKDCLNDDGI